MIQKARGFTLVELMIVVLIIGILAAAATPLLRGKIDEAKWSEAKAAAGVIRRAVKLYYTETGNTLNGKLSTKKNRNALGITDAEINGTYFVVKDYSIRNMNTEGDAEIRIKASQSNAPSGTKTLTVDGDWK